MEQLKRQLSRVHEGKKPVQLGSKQLKSDKITAEPSLSNTKRTQHRQSSFAKLTREAKSEKRKMSIILRIFKKPSFQS